MAKGAGVMKLKCEDCRFYTIEQGAMILGEYIPMAGEEVPLCFRYPEPKETRPTHWCGEYKKKENV
jgi:hypothetical protein